MTSKVTRVQACYFNEKDDSNICTCYCRLDNEIQITKNLVAIMCCIAILIAKTASGGSFVKKAMRGVQLKS